MVGKELEQRRASLDAQQAELGRLAAHIDAWMPRVETFQRWEELPGREATVTRRENEAAASLEVLQLQEAALSKEERRVQSRVEKLASRESKLEAALEGLANDTLSSARSLAEELRREHGLSHGRRG
jgi:chromosome segregation ATPase